MELKSTAFDDNQKIPVRYTCDGEDINPPLEIIDVPDDALSLALIVDDPDAPSGNFTHWLIWNISPSIRNIDEDTTPAGACEGKSDFGKGGYGGPCPHKGTHHYRFSLYALDNNIVLDKSADRMDMEAEMNGHIIVETTLTGVYERI